MSSDAANTHDSVIVRPARPQDVAGVIELCRRVYDQAPPWTETQLRSHQDVFPEGQLVAVNDAGRILGMAASLIVNWDDYDAWDNWRDFTDKGMFTNHDPDRGRTLYGAEVMVDPQMQGQGLGKKLYVARREVCQQFDLLRIRAGARLRGYHKHSSSLDAAEYVERVVRGELGDPTLSFQLRQGFEVLDVVQNYLRHDPESLGWAALIEWINRNASTPAPSVPRDLRFIRPKSTTDDVPHAPGAP